MMDVLSPEGMQQLVKEVKALGVPSGGTTDQILAKASADNYDTHWVDPPAGEAVEQTEYLVKAPIGTIVIWSGSADNIPDAWVLCDGANGTPDLRDKFVLGAGLADDGYHSVGNIGGEASHKLTMEEMPTHSHIENLAIYQSSGVAKQGTLAIATSGGKAGYSVKEESVQTLTDSHILTTATTGSSVSHNNMPPYYALCYIMKISPDPAVDGVTQAELTQALATKQDAFEVGSTLELTANARTAGGRLEVKTPVQSVLTQAEYDALSEEKKNKGLYVISDGTSGNGGGGGSSEEIYSTEETRIGTWIDGKPLYQRTWIAHSAATGQVWTETGIVIEDLDELVDYSVIGKTNISNVFAKLPFFENAGSYAAVNYWTGTDGKTGFYTFCYHQSGNYFYNMPLHITARYTKTTDTGGAR